MIIRTRDWIAHRRGTLIALAVLVVAVLGFAAIHKLTAEIRLSEVRAAFSALGWPQLSVAIGLTVVSYIALTFYDSIALKVIGHPLPWRTAAVASFTSYTISHNLGLAMLTGGSARYRVYSRAGLDEAAVARVVLIAGVTFWAGVITVACLSMAIHPGTLPIVRWTMPPLLERSVGIVIPLVMLGVVLRHRQGWIDRAARLATAPAELAAGARAPIGLDRRPGRGKCGVVRAAPQCLTRTLSGAVPRLRGGDRRRVDQPCAGRAGRVRGGDHRDDAAGQCHGPRSFARLPHHLLRRAADPGRGTDGVPRGTPVARSRHRPARHRIAAGPLTVRRAGVLERRDVARIGRAARCARSHGYAGDDPPAADQRDGARRGEPRRRDAVAGRTRTVPAARRRVLGGADPARRGCPVVDRERPRLRGSDDFAAYRRRAAVDARGVLSADAADRGAVVA
ncbi:hypothetical protein [Sphingomonas sp. H160509]|uniref:hypothetical protein n=1 Tax=Sphingomonas sp. H160509 TaxID=2955313 RepID=UPI003158B10D